MSTTPNTIVHITRNTIASRVCFSIPHGLIFTIGTCKLVPRNDPQERSYNTQCHLERSKGTRERSYGPVQVFTWAYSIVPKRKFLPLRLFETLPYLGGIQTHNLCNSRVCTRVYQSTVLTHIGVHYTIVACCDGVRGVLYTREGKWHFPRGVKNPWTPNHSVQQLFCYTLVTGLFLFSELCCHLQTL